MEKDKKENKSKYYMVWVPFYVEKKYVREFYNKDLKELRKEVDIERLKNLNLTLLEIKRKISSHAYKTYINLREASWWASLDRELKYKILYLKFLQLFTKENRKGKDFYPVHYRDNGKAYVIPFKEYIKMLEKKQINGTSIRKQLTEWEKSGKKEIGKNENLKESKSKSYKYKKHYILVPNYVEKNFVKDFFNKTLEEMRKEVDLEKLKTLQLTPLEIKRKLKDLVYPSYINLSDNSWWVLLDDELKYKIFFLKFDELYSKRTLSPQIDNSKFYKAYYVDKGKSYVLDFTEYLSLKSKKAKSRKSISKQLKEKKERKKKL